MIIHNFHLQPQLQYESFHIYLTSENIVASKLDSPNFLRIISLSSSDSSSLIRSLKSSISDFSGSCLQVRLEVTSWHSLLNDSTTMAASTVVSLARLSAIGFRSVGGFLPSFSVTKQN